MPWLSANSLSQITMVQGAAGIGDIVSSAYNSVSQHLVNISTDIEHGKWVISICTALHWRCLSCSSFSCRYNAANINAASWVALFGVFFLASSQHLLQWHP